MKKNSVLISVFPVLLSILLVCMGAAAASAGVTSNEIDAVHSVVFSSSTEQITRYILHESQFGDELPVLPEPQYWLISETGQPLTASTHITGDLNVTAVHESAEAASDAAGPLDGLSGYIAAYSDTKQAERDGKANVPGALTISGSSLKACMEGKLNSVNGADCTPSEWTFESAGICQDAAGTAFDCYYVRSGDKYLKITGSGNNASIGLTNRSDNNAKLIIEDLGGEYYIRSVGDQYLNFKYNSSTDFQFKGSISIYRESVGNRMFFYDGSSAVLPYTVSFNVDGGDVYPGPHDQTVFPGETIRLPEYSGSKNGHTFKGWSYGTEFYEAGTDYTPRSNVKLYAEYNTVPTLWLDVNGGDPLETAVYTTTGPIPLPEPVRSGYRFEGWSPRRDAMPGDADLFKTEYLLEEDAGDVFLYALWIGKVNVSFDTGIEECSVTPDVISDRYTGEIIDLSEEVVIDEAYSDRLIGWTDGQNVYDRDAEFTVPGRNVRLSAIWKADLKVTFDANGGDAEAPAMMTGLSLGQVITLPDYNGTVEGSHFIGWSDVSNILKETNADFSNSPYFHHVYNAGDPFTIVKNGDITLYAVWSEDAPQTIRVKFGLRLDGNIPQEPGNYPKDKYSSRYEKEGGNFRSNLAVLNKQWVIDITSLNQRDISDEAYFQSSAVLDALGYTPTLAEVNGIVQAAGLGDNEDGTLNVEKQFVYWYVLKYQGSSEGGFPLWHVDGVVVNKRPWIRVIYDLGEIAGIVNITNYPVGFQVDTTVSSNTNVWVGADGDINGVLKVPAANGYEFIGWKDVETGIIYGTDNPVYTIDTENLKDVTFVAQWRSKALAEQNLTGSQVIVTWAPKEEEIIPSAVKVKLVQRFADGRTHDVGTYTLSAADQWSKFVANLPAKDKNGASIAYEWVETAMKIGEAFVAVVPQNKTMYTVRTENGYAGSSYRTEITNTLAKKSVTITADSGEKVYDGTALTKNSYTNTALAAGDIIESVTVTGSQTAAGESVNAPSAAVIKNAAGEDVSATYNINYVSGLLKVTKKTLTITADSDEKVYDGTALTKDSYTNTALAAGDIIESVTVIGSQTTAGSCDNIPSAAVIKNAGDEDVSESYDITYANGTLKVTKTDALTITADSGTKVYDGAALTKDSYQASGLAEGDSVSSVTVTGSQTVAGKSDNIPSAAKIENAEGEDVTDSYEITYANGTLEVTKKAMTITAGSYTDTYNGSPLTKNSYTNTDLAKGDSIESVTVTGSQTVVGKCDNVPSAAKIVNGDGVEVTASYAITYANGTLEVTKKNLYIIAGSQTREYNGSALTYAGWTSSALDPDLTSAAGEGTSMDENDKGLATGDRITSVTVTGSQTLAGSSDNIPSEAVIVNADDADVTESYAITYVNGTLEVTKRSVTVTADSDTKVYDGIALTNDGYTNTDLAEGDSLSSVTVTGSQTVVGSSDNVPSAAAITNTAGADVTDSYAVSYSNGTLEVTKKAVTVTADSDTKVYDGTALTNVGWTSTGLAAGDSIESVTVTGSQTLAGSSDNIPSAAVIKDAAGADVTESYTVSYSKGTLEVTPKAVTVTAVSDKKVYDGTALTKDSYTSTDLAADDSLSSVTVTGSQTLAGSSDNVPSDAAIVNADGADVTESYTVSYRKGTLEVTPKAVTVTADSDEKVYDGSALTKNSYTNTDLASGDSLSSVTVTGSQTVAGSSDNVPSDAVIVNADGVDVTASYAVTYAKGTLKITPKPVTVTADSDEKVYDGSALTKNSYTSTDLASGDRLSSVTVTGSQTTAGSSDNVPSGAVIVNADGADVTASYGITYANGTLKITPKAVTVTADSDEKVYDGSALTKNSYTNTDLASGDSIETVTVTGSQTVAGSSDNVPSGAVIVNAGGADVTASYAITCVNGTLEVTKKTVTVTADSDEKVYDGSALTKNSYTSTDLASGDSLFSVTVTGSRTIAGSSDNVPSGAVIVNAGGADVTASYDITYANGTLEITPKPVTVTADSDTKVYDGAALTKDSYTNSALAEGDSLSSVTVTGSQIAAGRSDNVPSAAVIKNADGEDVTASYTITYANGTLEVTPKAVTVTADSGTKVYDGTALTKDSYTNTALAGGDSIGSVTVTGSQLVVGKSDNVPSAAVIRNAGGEDVTGSYGITYANGTLEVAKKSVTITADSDTKVYDGTALTKNSYTSTDLAAGDSIETVTVAGSRIVVGESANVASGAKIVNAAGEDVTASYEITYADGTLEVTKKAVTITAGSDTKVYNGTALTNTGYTGTALAEGDSIESVTVTGSQTVVGESANVASGAKIVNADGEDVTASYEITYADGTLQVTQNEALIITADSDTKVYDGSALTKDSYQAAGLAEGDSVDSVTVTGSQTVAGTSDNVPSAAVIKNAAGEDVTASYDITYANGTLEVTKKSVTITAESDTKTYDGTALAKNSYTNTDLADGDSFDSVTVTGSRTVVGTSDNVPSAAVIKNAAGEDVTANYDITYANGTLEVTKKSVTITAESDTKTYDGTALAKNSYTNTDLADGDSFDSVTVTGSRTVVGTSDNVPSDAVIINAAGEDVTDSYDITYANGTLEVTQKTLTITADSEVKVYDGTALTKDSYTNTGLGSGDTISSVTVTGSQTVVGTSDNVPSEATIVNADGADVTDSYDISYVNGTLEVTKKTVTVTADGDTKVYDGSALTKNSYTNTDLASGDSIESVTVTGSQTVAGSSANVPSEATIVNADGADVTDSYTITYVNGTLAVTQKTLTVTADGDTKVYDGTALAKNSYTSTALAEGDEIETVTVTGSQTVVGTSDNVPSAAKIVNAEGEDVTASYDISYVNGTLEVTPKSLTITADSGTQVYDGTALMKNSFTDTGLGTGDTIGSVTVTGSQIVVGTSDNVPSAAVIRNAADEDVTASYEITYANGTLEVTKKAVTVTADSGTKTYDGTALTKDSYTNTDLASGDSITALTVTGSQTVVGQSGNVPSAAEITNAAGEDVTASYDVTYVNGTLEVTQKTVTVTADSGTKVYDGTALVKDSYTSTALADGDAIDSVTVTGSQTIAGSSDNVPSGAVIKNAAGDDVTASYDITYANGTLNVTPKAVTVTADSDTKVYDGSALTKDSYTGTALAEGDSIDSVTVTGSRTVVGESANVPSGAKIVNADGEDVTASYGITYANGALEVTPKAVTVTAGSDTKVYDGTALTKDSYTGTDLASGDSFETVTVTGSQTVVGESANVPSAAVITNAAGEDVTDSYDITYANGTLEVTKKAVTVTADSDTKVYDGTALTKNSYTSTALAEGDSIETVTVSGSQTVVGTSDNVPSAAVIKNTGGADVTASYEITYAGGSLEVMQKAVTITAGSDTKVYDGTALTKNSYTSTDLASGDSIGSVTVTGSQTVAGSSDNVPSAAKIVNAAGEDVTGSYEITYVSGTLQITQNKALIITADSGTKVYDGTALTVDTYQAAGLANGDRVESVTVTGTQTVAGTSDNVPSAAKIVNAAGRDVTDSYEITYAGGTLEVTPKSLTVTAGSDTKVYDGTALTKNTYTNTALAEGDEFETVTVTGSQTVAGTSDNVPSAAVIKNAAGEDVTASYNITYANGTLEVTPKAVTVTADSDTKVYDGTALTNDSYTGTDLASGDSFDSVTVTGSQTTAGESDNVPSAAKIVNAAGEDVTDSYEVAYANGTLKVTPKAVTVTADSDTKVYDGTALVKDSYTNTELASGDSITVTVTGSQTAAGSSANVPSDAVIKNAAGADVTASYTITCANGTLEVTKKAVTVTADSDTKVYDGTALTKDSYTNTELASGDSFDSVIVTGSQTIAGSSANVPSAAVIKNAAGTDVTASYEITYVNGTLAVTQKPLAITAGSGEKVYDGMALTKNSYTNTELASGDSIGSVTVIGSLTMVGTSNNVPSAAVIRNAAGADVTASYDITYTNGTLKVTQKALTVTADSDTKIYDGTALTKNSFTNTALAEGDSITSVTVAGSQTTAGTSVNAASEAVIVNADGENVTAAYDITFVDGTLEVTQKAVTVTADSDTKVYDGTALVKDSYANTALAAGDRVESVTVTGSQTVFGTSENVPSGAKIVNAAGADVTASYAVTYANGTLEVTRKALTVTAGSDTKVYDGTALTKDSYTNTELGAGDSITVTVTGSQTVAGSSDNVPSSALIRNAAGADVTGSYTVSYVNGTLEVTQKAVTVTADSDTKVYDGTALTKDSYTNTDLAAGDSITVTVTGSQTVFGSSANVPSAAVIRNAAGADVTASYNITYVDGTLEVTKMPVTITAGSGSKIYDALPLTANTYSSTDLAAGDSITSLTVTGSRTIVGSADNVPSAAVIRNAANEDVTGSYEITYANGLLMVTVNRSVIITAGSDTKVYDGTELTRNSYRVDGLAAGDSVSSVTVSGSRTIVGSSDNVPSEAKIVNAAGEDVTGSYEVAYANGSLTVTQKAVTVTADSDTKVYDGTVLTKDSYTNTDLAAGDSITVTVTGSQTVFGSSANVPSAAEIRNAAGADVTASYAVTYVNGVLEVTQKAVTVTADSDTKVYDGTALTKNSFANTDLAVGDSITSVVTGSQTIVGSSANVPSAAEIRNAAGTDVTASYAITYVEGTLEVTQKAVTVTADSDTKVYDGTALTKNSFTNTALAVGDSITSVVTGSQTIVGSSANVPSGAVIKNAAGDDVTASYTVTYVNGTLTVTPKAVTVTADSDTKVYDGTALTKNSFTNSALAEGDSITVTVTGSQTVSGSSVNVPSDAVIVNAAGDDVTASYTVTYVNGTLTVTPKAVTVTADSDEKVYDGAALTIDSYDSEGLASGDSIRAVTVTGSQTTAGTSDNVPSAAVIVNAAGEDVTASYNITYVNGTLIVTPKIIYITADSDSKVYDGTALTKTTYTSSAPAPVSMSRARSVSAEDISVPALADGDTFEHVTVTGMQTYFGSSENVAKNAVIRNAAGENVTASYEIIYETGTLEVTRKPLIITAGSGTGEYNGEPHTNDGYSHTPLAEGDTISSVTVTGAQTDAGASNNVVSDLVIRNRDGVDVTGNYEVTFENGTLEVTRKTVTITAGSASKVYDGTPLTADSFTNTALAAGDSIDSVTVTGSQTAAGTSANVPSAVRIVSKNADGTDKDATDNYLVKYVNGELEVTKKALTITADSDTKVYDGTALTNNGYSRTEELAAGDTIASVTVTGSQTNAGSSANVPSAARIEKTEGGNVTDVTESYNITYINGELEVTKKDLPIRANSQTKVYDGRPLSENSYTVYELAAGDRIDSITVEGSRIQYGTSPNEVKDAVIVNEAGENVNDNYTISYFTGTLTVAAAPVTVAADNLTKEYGQLDMPFTARVTGVLEGEDSSSLITYELTREEGENPGEYVITPSGAGIQGNYSVSYLPGKLTITWNPTTFSAEKVWVDDGNRDGIRPVSLGVILTGSDGSIRTRRLSEANGWKVSVEDLPLYNGGQTITYAWSEEEVPGYTGSSEVLGNVTIFTNTHAIARTTAAVTKIWDDRDNAGGTRPDFLGVILFSNGERLFGRTLSDENNWTLTVDNLPMYEKGTPINYVWNEQSAGNGYYAVRSTASGGNTTLVNSNLYNVKIRYTFADGSEAAVGYDDRLGFGETFVVDSPVIAGYTAGQASVVGMMPSHDVEFNVIYTREGEQTQRTAVVESRKNTDADLEGTAQKDVPQVPEQMVADDEHPVVLSVPTYHVDIDEYDTALGFGDVYMTTGGKFSFE